jgi:UDP-N-acetylglucosamine transferase subunit ALG13
MIFVTTGTQLPFDRLVIAVIDVAKQFPDKKFVVQAVYDLIHPLPDNLQLLKSLSPTAFTDYLVNSELIISHAGVGSIVSGAQLQKVLILFPRIGKLKEHRNDHQVATCHMLRKTYPLHVAMNAEELSDLIKTHYSKGLAPMRKIGEHASPELIDSLKGFLNGEVVKGSTLAL